MSADLEDLARRWWPIRESLEHVGLMGFDAADLVTVMASRTVEALHVVPYEPGSGAWHLPATIAPHVRAAARLVVMIRCGRASTLFDMNAICQAIGAEAARDVPILVAAPVVEGPPVVAVLVIR